MNKKGFTLIELTIAIAVLALLLSVLVPNVLAYVGESDHIAAGANAKTAYSAAMQVSLSSQNTKGTLAVGDSKGSEGSDAKLIQNVIGSGVAVTIANTQPTDTILERNHAYIQVDDKGILVATYYETLESKYPKD